MDTVLFTFRTPSTNSVVQAPAGITSAEFVTLCANETVRVIELSGVYDIAAAVINVERRYPLVIRPAPEATATFLQKPGESPRNGLFYFGLGGRASGITIEDISLAGWTFEQTGLAWLGNAYGINLNRIRITNCQGLPGQAGSAFSLYLSHDGGVSPSDITADGWTILGSGRTMSGAQATGTSRTDDIRMRGWTLAGLGYALYDATPGDRHEFNDWEITDCGIVGSSSDDAVVFAHANGVYRNLRVKGGGGINRATNTMIDGGANVVVLKGA